MRRGRSVHRLRAMALVALLAVIMAACGGGEEADEAADAPVLVPGDEVAEDEGEPQYGGTVVMGLEAETNDWLPGRGAFASPGYNVLFAIYDPLMKRGADGVVYPYLAESMEPNEDLTVWTLRLRPDVRFHDGTVLDAAALETVYERYLKSPDSNLNGVLKDLADVVVVDDLTAEFHLSQGNAAFPDILTTAAGMPFSPTAVDTYGPEAGSTPVGTGPFRFVRWTRDSELLVERYEDYWREGLPYLDRIVFRPIPDEDTRLASLLAGDIDAMHTLRQSIVRQALGEESIETRTWIGNNGGGAIFNTDRPPVDDIRVRQGLSYAVNQDDLIEVLGGTGLVPPQTQYFSPNSPWYSEDVAQEWPQYDAELAAELLDEYINDPNRSDGKSPGAPISVEFNCPPDPSLIELSQLYQAFWQAVGVEVTLNQVEQATHIQNALQGEYVINCWRMGAETDPYITLHNAFGPPEEQILNFTNYHNELIAANLEILRTSSEFDTRYEAVESIMMHFTEAVPNLWTGGTLAAVATEPEINNVGGWQLPNGMDGDGFPEARVTWAEVWREQ